MDYYMKKIIYIFSLILTISCGTAKAQNYITHKVKSGETIPDLAQKYKVSVSEIYELNPDSKRELRLNSVLIIPRKKTESPSVTKVESKKFKVHKEVIGYKEHKVKRKETLYSLSKKYNITEADIKKNNTFLYDNNLRRGDKIQIPVYSTIRTVDKTKQTINKTKTHVVKPKEGKWRIAYKYGVTITELERLNPNMKAVLQPGDKINVPNISSIKTIDNQYSYYTVLKKEGFYRLKIKLGLTKEELENLNPELSQLGLKEGMILKIPLETENESQPINSDTITINEEEYGVAIDLSSKIIDYNEKHIAVMLPFRLNNVNTDSIEDTKKQITNDSYLRTSLDFYTGALTAFETLKDLGVNLKVDVYDTKNMQSQVNSIIMSNDFSTVNAVIGPLMAKNVNQVAESLKQYNVPVISPIIKKDVKLIDNVFQARPDEKLLTQKVVDFFKTDSTSHFVIISDSKNEAKSSLLRKHFSKASHVMSRKDKKTQEDEFYIIEEDLLKVIKPGNNVVFLETKNEGYVSNVTSILNSLLGKRKNEEGDVLEDIEETKIILATTDKNSAFEGEEISNYHLSNLSFHFPTVAKGYNDTGENSFVKRYKRVFKETPNKFAVRGYDVTMDVVLRIVTSQDLYTSVYDTPLTEYTENKFAYKKEPLGGYYNNTAYLVKYENLKVVEVE